MIRLRIVKSSRWDGDTDFEILRIYLFGILIFKKINEMQHANAMINKNYKI